MARKLANKKKIARKRKRHKSKNFIERKCVFGFDVKKKTKNDIKKEEKRGQE